MVDVSDFDYQNDETEFPDVEVPGVFRAQTLLARVGMFILVLILFFLNMKILIHGVET